MPETTNRPGSVAVGFVNGGGCLRVEGLGNREHDTIYMWSDHSARRHDQFACTPPAASAQRRHRPSDELLSEIVQTRLAASSSARREYMR
jgi:hypothetical protein